MDHLASLPERRLDQPPQLVLGIRIEPVVAVEWLDHDHRGLDRGRRLERRGRDTKGHLDPGVVLHEDRQVAHLPGRGRDPVRNLALDHQDELVPGAGRVRAGRAGSGS